MANVLVQPVATPKTEPSAPGPADPEPSQVDTAQQPHGAAVGARAVLWVGLVVLTVRFGAHSIESNYAGDSFLHVVNLVFHEAGHVLFAPFGQFVCALGGSLSQVLVPVVCGLALLRGRDAFGAAVGAWWAGQSLVDVAPYVNDARSLRLVLLGGRTGAEVTGHDWEFILQSLGWLHLDHRLAAIAHLGGLAVMVAALAWAAAILVRQGRVAVASAGSSRRDAGMARTGAEPAGDL